MKLNDHSAFFHAVEKYVGENPDCAAYLQQYVANGIMAALEKERKISQSWEIGLFAMLKKRFPNRENTVKDILQKNKKSAWLNWDWYFLENK